MSAYNALNNSNANGTAAAGTVQNQPISYYNQFSNNANAIGNGYGTNTGTTGSSTNRLVSGLGGMQLGGQIANNLGLGGNSNWVNGTGNYAQYQNADYGQFL